MQYLDKLIANDILTSKKNEKFPKNMSELFLYSFGDCLKMT